MNLARARAVDTPLVSLLAPSTYRGIVKRDSVSCNTAQPHGIRAGELGKQVTAFYNSWNRASVKLKVADEPIF
jgi:hypothetical protein